MIEQTLKSFFPTIDITLLKTNEKYGFQVKLANSKELGCTLVFTEGLSNFEQEVKIGFEDFKKIELYFCLPDYWDLESNDWPIEWIYKLAEIPQKNKTWYGPGDTIPAGFPPEDLMAPFSANHFMLVTPIQMADLLNREIWQQKKIQFLGILPISQFEFDYKMRNSATVLISRLQKRNYTEKVDNYRIPVCKKRFLGFF